MYAILCVEIHIKIYTTKLILKLDIKCIIFYDAIFYQLKNYGIKFCPLYVKDVLKT